MEEEFDASTADMSTTLLPFSSAESAGGCVESVPPSPMSSTSHLTSTPGSLATKTDKDAESGAQKQIGAWQLTNVGTEVYESLVAGPKSILHIAEPS